MTVRAWAALCIFVCVVLSIAAGKAKPTTATLLGASIMALSGLADGRNIVRSIDHDTVGLLVGMMIIVGILSKCGLFQYIAVKAVKLTKGKGSRILWAISFITMILSAFLDNVTTILLVTPVVLSLCDLIGLPPLPLLMAEVFASTIGGTGTLIGDPPNMIIGSVAGLTFNDFLRVMAPLAAVIWVVSTLWLARRFKKELECQNKDATRRLAQVNENRLIEDKTLMIRSLTVILFVLAGFVFSRHLGIEPSMAALGGAAALLAVTSIDDSSVIRNDVEWPTIIYFVSLFVMGGGLRDTGVIAAISRAMIRCFSGSPVMMAMAVLWISGGACIFINNTAFAAIFVYVVAEMAQETGMPAAPLYWALAMGCCLGGNGSLLGAAANAIMADLAAKNGIGFSFLFFMKMGLEVVFISLTIASGALYVICRLAL